MQLCLQTHRIPLPYYKPLLSPPVRAARRVWQSIAYRGKGVACPICDRQFSRYVAGDTGLCPGCRCNNRSRLLWTYLREQRPDLLTGSKAILQFAPDPGMERLLRKHPGIRYLSGDLYEPGVMVRLDLTHLDLPDECFDVVICIHVLAHISNDKKAMREILRVLRPGGLTLIMTPLDSNLEKTHEDPCIIDPGERDRVYGEWDFVRMYGRDFVERLERQGFAVEVVRPVESMDGSFRQKYGLWNEPLYLCRRPEEPAIGPDRGR